MDLACTAQHIGPAAYATAPVDRAFTESRSGGPSHCLTLAARDAGMLPVASVVVHPKCRRERALRDYHGSSVACRSGW